MKELCVRANAKLNLTLDVLGKRPDGYHDVRMVLQTIDLCDSVTVRIDSGSWDCVCGCENVPDGEDNLAMRAARKFCAEADVSTDGVSISIEKRIPTQAGLGGGSADAAAVLHALNSLCGERFSIPKLMEIGASIGSDVPFCVLGGTALAEGRGEWLTPLPATPDCAYLLLKPPFSAATPELYAKLDARGCAVRPDTEGVLQALFYGDLNGVASRLCNVFQPILNEDRPILPLYRRLLGAGALGAALTGSGSVVYGIFPDLPAAELAAQSFRDPELLAFVAQNA